MARPLNKSLRAQDLTKILGVEISHGSAAAIANFVCTAEKCVAQSLVFISDQESFRKVLQAPAGIIVSSVPLNDPSLLSPNTAVFIVPRIPQAMADVLRLVDSKSGRTPAGISSTACIHETAQLGQNVTVGEYAVIGAHCRIGDNTTLSSHVVVERGAALGSDCFLHPFVMIGAECELGSRVEIHSHSTIGSDGFGLVTQKDKSHQKMPQIGIVVIEDDVEIGANCAIDRATIDETRICRSSKFDNLVHIAHNCRVGANSRLAAGFFLAGSSTLGENFLTGGSSLVADHVHITDNVTIGGRSGVSKDVSKPGVYAGYPLEPFKENMKNTASFTKLALMRKQIAQIRRHLGFDSEQE